MRKTGWLAGLFLVLFLMVPAPVKAEKELVVDQAELFDEVQEQEDPGKSRRNVRILETGLCGGDSKGSDRENL